MGSSTAPSFNKKAHDTISPGPGIYQLNPSVGDQTLSTKRSAGRVTFNMGKRGEKKRYQGSLVHAYIDPHSRLDTRSASAFGASTADRFAQSKRDILNSCSPGPGSAWKHGIYSGLSKEGRRDARHGKRFMNDKKLSASDAYLNQSIVESVGDKKSFYEEDHARPGRASTRSRRRWARIPTRKMRSVSCPSSPRARGRRSRPSARRALLIMKGGRRWGGSRSAPGLSAAHKEEGRRRGVGGSPQPWVSTHGFGGERPSGRSVRDFGDPPVSRQWRGGDPPGPGRHSDRGPSSSSLASSASSS